ncbi:hypothetical protein HX882_06195 [Pseudomonas gingeri]|uniref:Uncharacterized protein n=1 Tax=Pseudomonas gingeri TaxID=117681 RepID=A0A7Y8C116_9PSED|nr:hypothetical protein [Pseudomonas gingeri]NWB95478.1 hypothetical protein [Pseudomonas gingeri]
MNKDRYQTHSARSITPGVSSTCSQWFVSLQMLTVFIVMSLSWSSAYAGGFWIDSNGVPIPDTESRRSIGEFGGMLSITSDPDWKEKWSTPADTTPVFKEAKSITAGEKVFALIFFTNPGLNADHEVSITCDLKVTSPNGAESTNQRDAVCFQGRIQGSPKNLYLAAPVIGFVGEPSDPVGVWTVDITLKDNVRTVVMPLKATFVLK